MADEPQILVFPDANAISGADPSDALLSRGIYYISGPVSPESLRPIQEDMILKHLNPNWTDDLQLLINSPGGDTTAMWALVDLMEWIRLDVRTVGIGTCCSAGAILLAAGTPGKRSATRNVEIMIHSAWIEGLAGNHAQLIAAMDSMDKELQRGLRFWTEHSHHTTVESVRAELITATDVFLTAEGALQHGVIDTIIEPRHPRPVPPKKRRNRSA